ncbi:alpha/beta fold hydrolase [Micromonospora sp. NPDC047644]|uniref:alpha/beta hydrolase n=1 Tax=Micromonospora sp. NPDC047644 TaxID=3157203 RepID=UPI003456C0BD
MGDQKPVIFIHGLWIHGSSWQSWIDHYRAAGYESVAPGWPGDADSVAATRANPAAVAGHGIAEIYDTFARAARSTGTTPIVVGHSFGGLIAQKLVTEGVAAAAVAIDPAPIRGVRKLPLSQLRSAFPVLSRRKNRTGAVSLTQRQFRYGFGNVLSREESDELHSRWTIPGPGRPLFEVASAKKDPSSPAAVDTARGDRGPLLIIGAEKDHTVPGSVAREAYDLYSGSPAVTDFHLYADRGHSLVFDKGWRQVADRTLGWLRERGF